MPGKSHGQRSLEGYRPVGHEESHTTKGTGHMHTPTQKAKAPPVGGAFGKEETSWEGQKQKWKELEGSHNNNQENHKNLPEEGGAGGRNDWVP